MKQLITTIVVVLVFGSVLFVIEKNRRGQHGRSQFGKVARVDQSTVSEMIRAAGRVEGQTEQIELRARGAEQIKQILVTAGQWVSEGTVLVRLDDDRLLQERDLAVAMLEIEIAKKERLVNGFRASEIETANQEHQAEIARLQAAEKTYARGVKLSRNNAISGQTLDDLQAKLISFRATAAAAKGRLATVKQPPRRDDLLAAEATVKAAQSRLNIAQIYLDRSQIEAPTDGKILVVDAEVGELTGPNSQRPLIIMSDTSRLRTVGEVDEYDALKVKVGQVCQIKSDASEGILARGKIVDIEPMMKPKRLFGQWAGERNDTYSRRVWIDLDGDVDLPVGLPVDVFIETK